MARKLIACFDGTWNTPDKGDDIERHVETNARRFYESVLDERSRQSEQIKWYAEGPGGTWYKRIPGLFGMGLSRTIRNAYAFLSCNYRDGDEIFVLGFSRGAYAARSLVGMLRTCGLLKRYEKRHISQAYAIYRTRGLGPDCETALAFRERHARCVPVKFVGVWDTVGSLGIPLRSFEVFNRSFYEFHDTELSGIVEHAYHAMAIDEHRREYEVTLWDPISKPRQSMEQRWFVGAHADIGGGYRDRRLSDITLKWMQDKAQACGLILDPERIPRLTEDNVLGPVRDSFKEFLFGLYRHFSSRHYRPISDTVYGKEVLDGTVLRRLQRDENYRPQNPGLAYEWKRYLVN